jgi:Ca-activated chloride channel homolog
VLKNVYYTQEGLKLPTPGAVRVEEMINYFSYNYPQSSKDKPFSITTEAAPCPWNEDLN